jgi:hypothetical protein
MRPPSLSCRLVGALFLTLPAIACGASRDSSFAEQAPGAATAFGPDGDENSIGPGGTPTKPGECSAKSTNMTRAKIDIVLVIDTSGSMEEETAQVRENLSKFASSIGGMALDYRVVVIGQKPITWLGIKTPGLCISEPLAGPDCADNPPSFHHVNYNVDSWSSLRVILDKFPTYSQWLRPSVPKLFIEVTDDNETGITWEDFDKQLLAKSPELFGDESARNYTFHSICGWMPGTDHLSAEKCATAETTGEQYQHVSELTGGTIASVCETDYSPIFDNLAKGLVAKLGCEFDFPKAENGVADPTKIVVKYTDGGGVTTPLTQVTDPSKCEANPNAWYYDDNAAPTQIVFCPSTCEGPGKNTAGKLEIAVGCLAPAPR